MQSVKAQPVIWLPLHNTSRVGPSTAYGRLKAFFATILSRRLQASADAVRNYEGHAWCDSTELQVITGIASCRRTAI